MKVCVVAYRIEKRLEPPFSSTNDLALLYLYIAEWLLPRGPGAITEISFKFKLRRLRIIYKTRFHANEARALETQIRH